jgi:hypothetical protein
MLPDAPKAVSAQDRLKFASWREGGAAPAGPELTGALQMGLLFHEAMNTRGDPNNGALRRVDQSWRVAPENADEVILVGRVAQASGPAEQITTGPASACRLWLGELPTSGKPRPLIPGTMRQDTYVRVFIPLAAK